MNRESWCLGQPEAAKPPTGARIDHAPILAAIARLMDSDEAEAARLAYGSSVSRAAILAVAAADLLAADRDTLRNVATSHASCAKLASRIAKRPKPWGWKVAQRARKVLTVLGLQAERHRGRRLRFDECRAARAAHGRTQTMAASTRDWTLPASLLTPIVHQPTTHVSSTALRPKNLSKRANARRQQRTTEGQPVSRSLAVQRFAARLVQRLPWLDSGHMGRVCRMVVSIGIDTETWTVQRLLDAMDSARAQLGWIERPERINNPLAHFFRSAKYAIMLARAAGRTPEKPKPQHTSTPAPRQLDEIERESQRLAQLQADPLWWQARAAFLDHIREPQPAPSSTTPPADPFAEARAAARAELARLRKRRQ